jgi:23S rRNA (uracil1939-C5)-methyltransferase
MPGDIVLARITQKKSNFAQAFPIKYLKRGTQVTQAPCLHFGFCGGCTWQNLSYPSQLFYKEKIVKDALERIGHLENLSINKCLPSDDVFAYRNKMEFSFSDNRWLLPTEFNNPDVKKDFALGFHIPGAFNKIVDIDKCHIQDDIFNGILNDIKEIVKNSGLPIYNLKNNVGLWRFLALRKGVHTNEYMINIVSTESVDKFFKPFIDPLIKKYPQVTSIVNNYSRRKAQIAIGEEELVLHGSNVIHEYLGPFKFEISAHSFFQTNTKQAEKMYAYIKNLVASNKDSIVFDLYSGTGTIAIYLAEQAKHVYGFELVESSVINARNNVKKLGIENCEFILGDVKENILAFKHLKPDFLIVDPPRDGMHKDVVATLLDLAAKSIIYVSCNPTSLARDLSILKEKYSIGLIQPLDMFPHTYHIETIVKLDLI